MTDSHLRNLPVPFFSQRMNTYLFEGEYVGGKENKHLIYKKSGSIEVSMANRSCNITCLTMLLHYFGVTKDLPDAIMADYFDKANTLEKKAVSALENWDILADIIYNEYKPKYKHYASRTCTITDLKNSIAAGYPVMISLDMINARGRLRASHAGSDHMVVVRGFTKIGNAECIILNDPWGSPSARRNNLVPLEGKKEWHVYNNAGSNGDNVAIKISEFEKMIEPDRVTIHNAMIIYAPLWQYPDGKDIDTLEDNDAINKNTSLVGRNFPISENFSWHNGIHFSNSAIHSIGAGRLFAARNKKVINGSASFMLVKHQKAGNEENKIVSFYALYMHTAYIDIAKCAESYFKTGKLPLKYNFKWLLQLFSNMLPQVCIIKNYNSDDAGGLLSTDYTNKKIYKAEFVESFGPIVRAKGEEERVKQFHGQRMLVHLLPAKTRLFAQLLNPANYMDENFQRRMLDVNNFSSNGHIFFHSYDESTNTDGSIVPEILYSKIEKNSFFEFTSKINKNVFKLNAEKLSQLNNDEVVSFDDLVNFPVDNSSILVNSFKKLLSSYFLNKQKQHWNEMFEYRITDNKQIFVPTDNFFIAIEDIYSTLSTTYIDNKSTKENIYKELNNYFIKYKKARCNCLKSFLQLLISETNESNTEQRVLFQLFYSMQKFFSEKGDTATNEQAVDFRKSWQAHLRNTLNNCFFQIVQELEIDVEEMLRKLGIETKDLFVTGDIKEEKLESGSNIALYFVEKLKELNSHFASDPPLHPGYTEIAIEIACCKLCSIDKNIIKGTQYFDIKDGAIKALLTSYSDLLDDDFNSFQIGCQPYIDTIIEIPKNDIIGKSGRYYDEINMTHFEIVSAKNLNIYTDLKINNEQTIIDKNTELFFMSYHIIKILKDYIIKSDIGSKFEYLDGNIMRQSEFEELNKSNIFLTHAVEHISEWSPKLDYEYFKKNHERDTNSHTIHVFKNENTAPVSASNLNTQPLNTEEYFKQCTIPYSWNLETNKWKNLFPGDVCTCYHPLYFLHQLTKHDDEITKT